MSLKDFSSYGVGKCLQTAERLSNECGISAVALQMTIKIDVANWGMCIPHGSGTALGCTTKLPCPGVCAGPSWIPMGHPRDIFPQAAG